MSRDETQLTDSEEHYAQLRASGLTKTQAAAKAYPDSSYPKQGGYRTENRERVKDRILELKQERAENAGVDYDEQLRRYNELYRILYSKGDYKGAAKILERIDTLAGFEAPSKSISIKTNSGNALKDEQGNLENDINRFADVLGKHSQNNTKPDSSVH